MKFAKQTILLISCLLFFNTAQAVAEGEFRTGLLAGDFSPMGGLSDAGHSLGYGLHFGYMFTDDMVFEVDYLSSSSDDLSHTNLSILVNYYYSTHKSIYFNMVGGLALIQNSVKTTTKTLSGDGVGIAFGGGLDFDLSQKFIAGFQLRYNFAMASTDDSVTPEITTVDSFMTLLARISYVY